MSDAREQILARVRRALGDVPTAELPRDVAVTRGYRHTANLATSELLDRLENRLRDYGADVARIGDEVASAVSAACRNLGVKHLALPPDLPRAWRPQGIQVVPDERLSAEELDRVDGALTGCAAAIAETGTLVLDGQGACGRRMLTLVPDNHICVVKAEQVVGLVPEAIARVAASVRDGGQPVTLISGPSASSDIELSRVEGVHGPRHLVVLIATEGS
jgi:L-lactate dehydrogenase complex protein LldG